MVNKIAQDKSEERERARERERETWHTYQLKLAHSTSRNSKNLPKYLTYLTFLTCEGLSATPPGHR